MKTEIKDLSNSSDDYLEAFMHAVIDSYPPEDPQFLLNHLIKGTTPKVTTRDILFRRLKIKIGRQLLANIEQFIHDREEGQEHEEAEDENK